MITAEPANLRGPWRQALSILFVLLAWVFFLYRDTATSIVTIWMRSETFTHGFMVPPIALWLIWRRRMAFAVMNPQPDLWGILFLAAAAFAWLIGELVAVNAPTQLAFVAMLVLMVPIILGRKISKTVMFPLCFLFFAVPFGEFAMPQFMVWTADFTVLALRGSGIPVYREGLQFVIPSGNWSVVEACSGIRYLIASVTVGTLFAYLNYQSLKRRVIFIGVSILVPVLANWLRAYIIVMLGHLSGNKLAAGVDHIIYGWLFFGVVIMIMFMIGARWAEPEKDVQSILHKLPMDQTVRSSSPRWALTVTMVALLVTLPHIVRQQIIRLDAGVTPQMEAPAALAKGWAVSPDSIAQWKPAFESPSTQFNATYRADTRAAGVYLGYYRQQDYSRKLVSSENVLVKSKDTNWAQLASVKREIVIAGRSISLRQTELRALAAPGQIEKDRILVWQVYWINGTWTSSDSLAKIFGAWHRLMGRGDDSAVLIVYANKGLDGEGVATLEEFFASNFGAIEALLQQTRERR